MAIGERPLQALRGARFPGRYIQGRSALDRLGPEAASYGGCAHVLFDRGIYDRLAQRVEATAQGHVRLGVTRHGGECTDAEIDRVKADARRSQASVIVGIGGGKALDTAKAAAHALGLPIIVVPTIAASDAPCSALAVVYNPDGTVAYDAFLPRNPDLVLVDTGIIAQAPARFLAAGIGDALATWYEAQSCHRSGAGNCMGMPGATLAYHIAAACRETIVRHGAEALAQCDRDQVGEALDQVVEANILMSGIGFESGGVAAAHAIHHGLCELEDVHHHLHGEKVAIGVLAGLLLHDRQAEFVAVRTFCQSVRLPVRLSDIGIIEARDAKLAIVAERACRAGEIIHNEPFPITPTMVVAALKALV